MEVDTETKEIIRERNVNRTNCATTDAPLPLMYINQECIRKIRITSELCIMQSCIRRLVKLFGGLGENSVALSLRMEMREIVGEYPKLRNTNHTNRVE